MKKISLILIGNLIVTLSHAQITNTRWKSTLNINGPVNAIFDFKKDTVSLYTVSDSTIIETMSYTNDGSSVTLKKIEGQSDCDNDTPGKYSFTIQKDRLYLKMIADNCSDRSTAIDTTRWTRWKEHIEVTVKETILKQYAGVYQSDSKHPINISFEDGRLYAEGPNNGLPKSPLIAESKTKFFLKIAGVEWDFIRDSKGKVVKLISHEQKDYELIKVK